MSWLMIIGVSWLVSSVVVGLVVGRAIGEDERRAASTAAAIPPTVERAGAPPTVTVCIQR
jgi:hypothetical protein